MPQPRGVTPTLSRMKDWAQLALERPNGLTLTWKPPEFSPQACAQHARGFQTSFTSMRARARRLQVTHEGYESPSARDLYTRGPYDALACVREPLVGGGWSITLCRGQDMFQGVQVTDALTGEPIEGESAEDRERTRIFMKAQQFPEQVTQAEYDLVDAKRFPDGGSAWNRPDTGELWFPRPSSGYVAPPAKLEGLDHLIPSVEDMWKKDEDDT